MMEKQQSRTDRQSVRANAPAACGKASLNARMMLRDVRHCQLRTLALCARAERYREMAMQATGRTDAIRVSGTGERSKVETYILELWDVHNELQEEIARLTKVISTAVVVADSEISTDKVSVGTTVKVQDVDSGDVYEYAIVGAEEADPYEDKISNESPVGAGLMGAAKGQTVEIEVPMGLLRYKVLDIKR